MSEEARPVACREDMIIVARIARFLQGVPSHHGEAELQNGYVCEWNAVELTLFCKGDVIVRGPIGYLAGLEADHGAVG